MDAANIIIFENSKADGTRQPNRTVQKLNQLRLLQSLTFNLTPARLRLDSAPFVLDFIILHTEYKFKLYNFGLNYCNINFLFLT